MSMRPDKHIKYENFRFITPILVSISLLILTVIWNGQGKMQDDIVGLKVAVSALQAKVK